MLKLGEGTGIDYTPQLTQRLKNGQIHIHGVASIIAKNIIILVNYFFKSVTFGGGGGGGGVLARSMQQHSIHMCCKYRGSAPVALKWPGHDEIQS